MAKTAKTEDISEIFEKAVKTTKEILDAQDKVKIKIPQFKDRKDTFVPVCINGYRIDVPVNVSTSVPESVAALLEEAGYI